MSIIDTAAGSRKGLKPAIRKADLRRSGILLADPANPFARGRDLELELKPAARPDLHRSRCGHHGPHGHRNVRRHDRGAGYSIRRHRPLLLGEGTVGGQQVNREASAWWRVV